MQIKAILRRPPRLRKTLLGNEGKGMPMSDNGNFEILGGYPADVLAIAAHRRITRDDYENILIPEFEKKARAEGKVRLLILFGADFDGYSPGAAWDDAKFGLLHMREIAGLAVVTDHDWLRLGIKTFAPLIPCPVALYHLSEIEQAKAWVAEWKHESPGGPGADVDRKLPTLEDKG
jgi:hypothetical protein